MKEAIIQYITPRVEKRKEILEKELLEKKTKESAILFLTAIVNISALGVAFMNPIIGAAMALISMGVFCLKFRNCLELDKREKRIKNEITYLKKLKKDFNSSEEERNTKIVQLRRMNEMKIVAEDYYKKARMYTNIFVGMTFAGLLGFLITPYLGIMSLSGIILSALAVGHEVKTYGNYQSIKMSANDLNHYIEFSRIIDRKSLKKTVIGITQANKEEKQIKKVNSVNADSLFEQIYYNGEDTTEKPFQYRKEK